MGLFNSGRVESLAPDKWRRVCDPQAPPGDADVKEVAGKEH